MSSEIEKISFDMPKNKSSVIKVIGVGGGGSNAINHMFRQGIKGVDFIVCNTDAQALENSPVPNKVQLGVNTTEGLGAGANPQIGQQSAIESMVEIEQMLDVNTKMVFITAGMGGGTGTGAAPIIAKMAKEKDILTVGIVTIPFSFEGASRKAQALEGVEKLRGSVDSLIVINNDKLRDVYGNLGFKAGYAKSDEVLAIASRGIAEIITKHYAVNIDLRDAKTVLTDSGTAIMGSAVASGENRAKDAIVAALDSPLLNDNKITGAKNVLLLIVSGSEEITIDEITTINEHIQHEAVVSTNIIMGVGEDENLGDAVAVTVIATGFNGEQQNDIVNLEPKKIIYTIDEEKKVVHNFEFSSNSPVSTEKNFGMNFNDVPKSNEEVVFELIDPVKETPKVEQKIDERTRIEEAYINNIEVEFEIISPKAQAPVVTNATTNFNEVNTFQTNNVVEFGSQVTEKPVSKVQDVMTMNVVDPIQFVSGNEETGSDGLIRHSLEDFLRDELNTPLTFEKKKVEPVKVEDDFGFVEKKIEPKFSNPFSSNVEINNDKSPMELPFDEAMKLRAAERRSKLKDHNHNFNSNISRFDEIEKVPAFVRKGMDVNANSNSSSISRISINVGNDNELNFRSNNSFLHDNVD